MCAQPARNAYTHLDTASLSQVPHQPFVPDPLTPRSPQRVLSIDILRGATIALMILVNDPGDPQCVYPPLRHADWNGYTAADLVFPELPFSLWGVAGFFAAVEDCESGKLTRRDRAWSCEEDRQPHRLKLFVAAAPTFACVVCGSLVSCSARRCWGCWAAWRCW